MSEELINIELQRRHDENLNEHSIMTRKYCLGIKKTGYWRGRPCNHYGLIQTEDQKWWCANHVPLNVKVICDNR